MGNQTLLIFGLVLAVIAAMVLITIIIIDENGHRCHKPKFKLRVYFVNKINHFYMASINSITLTDALAHTGLITVGDDAGNSYTGTLANVQIAVADPSQDTVTLDPNTPNTIDVQEANPTGGTTATLTADFTSQGNATPPA